MKDSAKPLFPACSRVLGFMLVMVLMFGCQSFSVDPRGRTVPQRSWITIPQDGESSGTWTNEDLIFAYKFVRNQSQLKITATIKFADRITKAYPIVQYFHLDAVPLDAQGKVLDMVGLTTTASVNTFYDNSVEFNHTLTLPPNSEAIALTYQGRAYGSQDSGTVDFWEYPLY